MRINDFERMQQNLEQMKKNLENINSINIEQPKQKKKKGKGRRAADRKINLISSHPKITKIAKEEQIIVLATIAIVAITSIFSTSIFAKTISENVIENQAVEEKENKTREQVITEEKVEQNNAEFVVENNENAIQLEDILLENVSVLKSKEYAEEIRPIEFETIYQENPNLPEGEEVITQEGMNGIKQVTVIKSYENNVLVAENILEEIPLEDFIPQKVDIGTSKFLANNKVHLGDTMYVTDEVVLQESTSENAEGICTILESLDVILEELISEEWCKVEYDGLEGYIKCEDLTSAEVMPEIIEANRIQKIKMTLSKDMPLNQSTDLTLEDYKKILSGNSADKNKIIEDNAEVFYNMDKTYHINGVFLASMAIHESAWGTSTIAQNKKNLFGYGAYDSSPYESSFSFEDYAEGIELVSKVLVKYYINEEGTPIYEEELAKGSYYNGPTVSAVNIRYASDENWHNKIYKYMEYLYNKL